MVALETPQSLRATPSTTVRSQLVPATGMGRVSMMLSQHRLNSVVANFCGKSWGMFYIGERTSQKRERAGPIRANATCVVAGAWKASHHQFDRQRGCR